MQCKVNYTGKQILIFLWILFSIGYIIFDLWHDTLQNIYESAYVQGKTETVQLLIKQAQNENCQVFDVYTGSEKVSLINVDCLQASQPANSTPATLSPANSTEMNPQ